MMGRRGSFVLLLAAAALLLVQAAVPAPSLRNKENKREGLIPFPRIGRSGRNTWIPSKLIYKPSAPQPWYFMEDVAEGIEAWNEGNDEEDSSQLLLALPPIMVPHQ